MNDPLIKKLHVELDCSGCGKPVIGEGEWLDIEMFGAANISVFCTECSEKRKIGLNFQLQDKGEE